MWILADAAIMALLELFFAFEMKFEVRNGLKMRLDCFGEITTFDHFLEAQHLNLSLSLGFGVQELVDLSIGSRVD